MAKDWLPEFALDEEGARRRIERDMPDLAPARLVHLGAGWDNDAWEVNGAWVFRFPRRAPALDLMRAEIQVLPALAPHLPVSIPVPVHVGQPDDDYPHPWAGYRRLPGQTACRAGLSEAQRRELALPLAHFLRALHHAPVSDDLGDDVFGRGETGRRARRFLERLPELAEARPDVALAPLARCAERLVDTPLFSGTPVTIHGDLYGRHLLVDEAGGLTGVIDWGDVHRGDPAGDLSVAWSFLPPEAHATFRSAYGPIDAATWARARFRALQYGLFLSLYAADTGDAAARELADLALAVADPALDPA